MTVQEPVLERSLTLNFIGDWGQANFHRICSWLAQEFCDRAGPRSRVAIWNIRGGGIEAVHQVGEGEAQMCLATPAMAMPDALAGRGLFEGRAQPQLRALAVLPQNDRLVMAVDAKLGIGSFEELRQQKPPLRIAASVDDGTNFIGHVTRRLMAAHGIDEATLNSWGGQYVTAQRPEQCLARFAAGETDAVIQEAIMTPWWRAVMEDPARLAAPLAAEPQALARLETDFGYGSNGLPAGFWTTLRQDLPALDFSDFVVLVRSDMPADVAHLLTWCIVERRSAIERQYQHLPPERSPLTYPLAPDRMWRTPIPLHPGARRYYEQAGLLEDDEAAWRGPA